MSGLSPEALRRKVTSKGGTTEAAIGVMEGKRVPEIVREALRAAMKRGRELEKS
jgi:pyrroline-5-carboxylate reductase